MAALFRDIITPMLMNPLLSVSMPTFSNPIGVKTSLAKLINEAKNGGLIEAVEFCVADNSEDAATESIINDLKTDPAVRINYLRHGHNLGYDRNVDAVIKLASGDFCWLLSDNEDLRDGALRSIVETLKSQSGSGLVIIAPETVPAKNLRTYSNLEEAVIENDWWIPGGLVSRNIIKKSLIPADLSPYYGNDWLHLSVTTQVGGRSPVTFVAEKFIHDPNEKSRWAKNGKTFVTYTNLLSIIKHLPSPPYSKEFVATLGEKMLRGLPRNILSSKIYGLKATWENWKRLFAATRERRLYLLISSLAMCVPPSFVIYGKKIKHSLGN